MRMVIDCCLHFTGAPGEGQAVRCGKMVTTHRDTFRGESLASTSAPSESVKRQQQRITCIPQGEWNHGNEIRHNKLSSLTPILPNLYTLYRWPVDTSVTVLSHLLEMNLRHNCLFTDYFMLSVFIGDPSKVAVLHSNHQTSYHAPPQPETDTPCNSCSRTPVTRQINQSSINLKDHTKPPSHYFTTTTTHTFQQPIATGENTSQ